MLGLAVLVKPHMCSRWIEHSTGKSGSGAFGTHLGSKSKEHKDDGNLHVQPADKDLEAREARPWLFAVEDAGWGWGLFRLLAQGQVLEVGEEVLEEVPA